MGGRVRFERTSAFVIGALLPILETCRRGIGHWSVDFTTMFEDYVAGALLLVAAWASHRGKTWSGLFLVLAWAYVTGMMGPSFWYQLEETLRGTANEPYNLVVLAVKLILWAVCVLSLILSFRRELQPEVAR